MTRKIPWDITPVGRGVLELLARRLTVWACGIFGVSVLFSILSLHCLYADGSYQLTEVLRSGDFVSIAKNRDFADFIFQFPVVMAIRLGVTNLYILQLAFGLGCFLPWPIVMLFCHWMAPRHFWLVMLGGSVGYLNSAFISSGEYIVAHAFFWPVLFAISFVRPLTPLAAAMLIVSALILVFSYESLLFLGPLLALLAIHRMLQKNEAVWARVVFGAATILLILAAVIAADGVLHPQSLQNFGGFKQGLLTLFLFPSWTIGWSFVWLLLLAATCLDTNGFTRRFFGLELVLLAGAMAIWGLWPVLSPKDLDPVRQYHDRSLQLLVSLGLLVVACTLRIWPKWFEARRNFLIGFSASLLLAQSLWQISTTWQWQQFVQAWREVLAAHHGPVSLRDTPFASSRALPFDWNWANPSLSLMMSPDGRVKSIILAPDGPNWQPFDARDLKALPDLRRYGVDYGDYQVGGEQAPVARP